MPIKNNSTKGLPGSDLADQLKRQIDAETIIAGLNGDVVTSQEIRLRAAVSARHNNKKIPLRGLEQAITLLDQTETKHIARREVAKILASKKKFLISIYPEELKKATKSGEMKKISPEKQIEWPRQAAWARSQLRIERKFGSPAPSVWSQEAQVWAAKFNNTKNA